MGSGQTKSAQSKANNGISQAVRNKFFDKRQINTEDAPNVDLCFMFDCTGSMGPYIEMARKKINDITSRVKESYFTSQVRIGVVAYRDIADHNRFEVLPFTEDVYTAKDFLDRLGANEGGDTPEDVNGAFQKVLFTMEWKHPVRMLVHVADAPCHGKDFHNYSDNYPKGYKEDLNWNKIFKNLVEKRLDYLLLKITEQTDKMFTKFKTLAKKHEASKYELTFEQEVVYNSAMVADTEAALKMAFKAEAFDEINKRSYASESHKMQDLCEHHFTETIAQHVQRKVNYVQAEKFK